MSTDAGDRRGGILAAALECFNEKGLEAAGIGEICSRSGASIGSVYHHFGSKEGIAAALLLDGLRSNTDLLEERLGAVRGARDGVHAVVASLIDWIAAHPEWARFIYTVSHGSVSRVGGTQLQAVNRRYARLIEDYFRPHIEAGEFRSLPEECFASLVIGPVHDYARRWLNGHVSGDIQTHAEVFASAAWRSVRSPRPGAAGIGNG